MASESLPPPPPPGGGARYAILGVALLALAGIGYCALLKDEAPSAAPQAAEVVDASTAVPSRALDESEFIIPPEEPDAWVEEPDAGPPPRVVRTTPLRGSWDCEGQLERSAITSVIDAHRPQIQDCYQRQLKLDNTLRGSMQLQLRVTQSGAVDAVQVGGSLRNREVFACVRNVATRMQFERVTGGNCAIVAVPFSFSAR